MKNTVIIVFGSTSACCIMVPRPLTQKNSVDVALRVVKNKQSKLRKHLTIGDKLKVLAELDSGKSNRSIAKLFDISEDQVRIIGKNRERLLEVKENGSRPLHALKADTRCEHSS